MNRKGRKLGKTPPVIFVFIGAAAIIILILALGIGGGGTDSAVPPGERSSPFIVHERTVTALEQNDPSVLYEEFSPSMQGLIPLENLIEAEEKLITSQGEVIAVQEIQPLMVLTGPDWNSQWAQSKVRITREQSTQDYVVRYFLEDGQWWLFTTIAE